MECGKCDGWVHIFIADSDPEVNISIRHKHEHAPYEDINLLEKWKQFIRDNLRMSPQKVFLDYFFSNMPIA
jgi:hypothetical protein